MDLQGRSSLCTKSLTSLNMMAFPMSRSKFSSFVASNQSFHKILRDRRKRYVNFQCNRLLKKIQKSLEQKDFNSPHIPLIIMSSKLISNHISFDNVIILNNPSVIKNNTNKTLSFFYDEVPYFVGSNISNFASETFTLTGVKGKKIVLLAKLSDFEDMVIINSPFYHPYILEDTKIPSNTVKPNPFPFETFILISSICNEKYNNPYESILCDDELLRTINTQINVNVRGDGKKHFQSMGKYFGFDIVAKYKTINSLSFRAFAPKKGEFLYDNTVTNNRFIYLTFVYFVFRV